MCENKSYVRGVVCDCLENMGVIIDINALDKEDINLIEYGLESLAFISFVVDLEERLNIVIPDEYLRFDVLQSLNGFINLVMQVVDDIK